MANVKPVSDPIFARRRLILSVLLLTGLLGSVAIVVLENQHLQKPVQQAKQDESSGLSNVAAEARAQAQAEFDAREERSRAAAASPLHWAIQKDDHVAFISALDDIENVGARDQSGNSALHEAVRHQRFAYIVALLLMGADPQAQNAEWKTPYYLLSRKAGGSVIDRYRRLLDHTFSSVPPEKRKHQATLIVAVEYDDESLLSSVIDQGVMINEPWGPDGDTSLHHVASAGVAKHLIKAGANVDAQDHSGATPLIAAVNGGDGRLVRHLIQAGADVNLRDFRDRSALYWAIHHSRSSLSPAMSVLLNYDSEVGLSEWRLAVESRKAKALKLLLGHGAAFSVNSPDGEQILNRAQMLGGPMVAEALDNHETIGPEMRKRARRQSSERNTDLARLAAIIAPHLSVFFCFVSVVPLLFGLMLISTTTKKLFIWPGTFIASMMATYLAFFPLDVQEFVAAARWSGQIITGLLPLIQAIALALSALSALIVLSLFFSLFKRMPTISKRQLQISLILTVAAFTVLALHHFEHIKLLDRSYLAIVGDPKETLAASGLFRPKKKQQPTSVAPKPEPPWIDQVDPDSFVEIESALLTGSDPNVKNRAGSTALHLAVSKRSLPLVELLLKYGADTELRDKRGNTALQVAQYDSNSKDRFEIVSLLLAAGSDPNAPGFEQVLPLCRLMAQERDHNDHTAVTSIANLLLDAGADVKNAGCAPLHYTRVPDRIEWLLANGAQLEAKAPLRRQGRTEYGKVTPLWNAVNSSDIPLVEAFLMAGADVNARDSVTGYTPLHLAIARVRYQSKPKSRDLSMIDILLSNGADPDAIAYDGTTVLALDAHQITLRTSD